MMNNRRTEEILIRRRCVEIVGNLWHPKQRQDTYSLTVRRSDIIESQERSFSGLRSYKTHR